MQEMSPKNGQRDRKFLDIAYRYGERARGQAAPNPAVGAVLVRDDGFGPQIVGRGWTGVGGRPHAEAMAIEDAGDLANGATCYVSLEPCSHHGKTPPCSAALVRAGVKRVVAPGVDEDERVSGRGFAFLEKAGVEVTVIKDAERFFAVHEGHFSKIRSGFPSLTLKIAVSRNLLMGDRSREVPITGREVKRAVYDMRSRHDALLTGIGTVRVDDPQFTCRLPGMMDHSPIRIVLDPTCTLSPESLLARSAKEVPVYLLAAKGQEAVSAGELEKQGVQILSLDAEDTHIPMISLLGGLGSLGLTSVLVEAGPSLASFFLSETPESLRHLAISQSPHDLAVEQPVAAPDQIGDILNGVDADFRLCAKKSLGDDILYTFQRKEL